MNETFPEEFEQNWKDFLTHLKARLEKRCRTGFPNCEQLNLLLQDCVTDWESAETVCGRWLSRYASTDPDGARLIRQILTQDMRFQSVEKKGGIPQSVQIAVPAAGFAAGLLISHLLQASPLVQAASAVVPAAILLPSMRAADDQLREAQRHELIDSCLEQLRVYHERIARILRERTA